MGVRSLEYTIDSLKEMSPVQLKQLLSDNKISFRDIAEKMELSPGAVSDVINNKYKGSKITTEKVYVQIAKMLSRREDLTEIYANPDMFLRLINIGIKHKNFNNDETAQLISIANKINKFIEHQSR